MEDRVLTQPVVKCVRIQIEKNDSHFRCDVSKDFVYKDHNNTWCDGLSYGDKVNLANEE
ncbi:hypothetical protein RvY_02532 [Ramazzottius varieornatus]|uniref:Uncharacterized protein n=1 Tax=Ramazzottius varieornatus TaxID=947166 RepID=A0A1D1UV61_RAMVA|nr:hypothetical protein RvY_02532 [Ramazzottius varieornatus]